jgi:hypothetical protein
MTCNHSPDRIGAGGKCLDCKQERARNRKAGVPNPGNQPRRDDGWTVQMSKDFKAEQRAKATGCASCGAKGVKLVADHNHAICPEKSHACPKCFRGMICHSCNRTTLDWPEGKQLIES